EGTKGSGVVRHASQRGVAEIVAVRAAWRAADFWVAALPTHHAQTIGDDPVKRVFRVRTQRSWSLPDRSRTGSAERLRRSVRRVAGRNGGLDIQAATFHSRPPTNLAVECRGGSRRSAGCSPST